MASPSYAIIKGKWPAQPDESVHTEYFQFYLHLRHSLTPPRWPKSPPTVVRSDVGQTMPYSAPKRGCCTSSNEIILYSNVTTVLCSSTSTMFNNHTEYMYVCRFCIVPSCRWGFLYSILYLYASTLIKPSGGRTWDLIEHIMYNHPQTKGDILVQDPIKWLFMLLAGDGL